MRMWQEIFVMLIIIIIIIKKPTRKKVKEGETEERSWPPDRVEFDVKWPQLMWLKWKWNSWQFVLLLSYYYFLVLPRPFENVDLDNKIYSHQNEKKKKKINKLFKLIFYSIRYIGCCWDERDGMVSKEVKPPAVHLKIRVEKRGF